MTESISRRKAIASPLILAGCGSASPYFGRIIPPNSRRLVHSNGEEPSTLDPAQSVGGNGDVIIAALLDSLTSLNPLTLEPAAGLATHYQANAAGTQYTFYLRGHPKPQGIRLPNTDSLPADFVRGRRAPDDRVPAFWSDGTRVTAGDFVRAWRRLAHPATAAPLGFYLTPVVNAEEVTKGVRGSEDLGVRALDEFTFQFDLTAPISSFVRPKFPPPKGPFERGTSNRLAQDTMNA